MFVDKIKEQIDSLVGTSVEVSGRVVVTGDDRAFLTSGPEAFELKEAIPVRDGSRIAKYLLKTLPSYVGGPFLYDEECTLIGTIQRGSNSHELHDVRQCKVRRGDIEIRVPDDGG